MQKNTRDPKKMSSYFRYEAPILVVVTISGLIYNIGMVAGPYFQGQLAQGLYDLPNHKILANRLIQLSLLYMLVIALVQVCRAIKRFSVRILPTILPAGCGACPITPFCTGNSVMTLAPL